MHASIILILIENAAKGVGAGMTKILLHYSPPLLSAGIRNFCAGLILLFLHLVTGQRNKYFSVKFLPFILKGAFFRIFLPTALSYWAIQYISAVKLAFYFIISPFVAYLLSYLFFKERMTTRRAVGLVLGLSSIIPLLLVAPSSPIIFLGYNYSFLPDLAIIAALTSVNYGSIDLKLLRTRYPHIPVVAVTGCDALIGGIFGLICSFFIKNGLQVQNPVVWIEWIFLSIVLMNGISWNLYSWLLGRYSATLLSLASLSSPFFTALFGWFYLGEKLRIEMLLSTVIVLIGLMIFYSDEAKMK